MQKPNYIGRFLKIQELVEITKDFSRKIIKKPLNCFTFLGR